MFPSSDATRAEIEAVYKTHSRSLRALARELKIPDAAAEELIDGALIAALVQKSAVDTERWLAATLKAAAKGRREDGE